MSIIIDSNLSDDEKKYYINRENRINQLLAYCYHKLGLPETLLAHIDYYKSFSTKNNLSINPDISSRFSDLRENLSENKAIITFTNINTEDLFSSIGIGEVTNPIMIYLDKKMCKSFFMYDEKTFQKEKALNNSGNFDFIFNEHSQDYKVVHGLMKNRIDASTKLNNLYNILIQPFDKLLKRNLISEIVIIPEDNIFLIPFEALIDNEGKYLIQKYNINYSYTYSMLIEDIKNNSKEKEVLAIGNPSYKTNADHYVQLSENELSRKIKIKDVENSNLSNEFFNLGYFEFNDLPGTGEEIKSIKKIFPKTLSLIGDNASEDNIKKLSENLELQNYNIIHFACHGFYDERYSKLSSLVLSTNNSENSSNDGFLTLKEISNLNLNSTFINLSACNTARGEMYSLEGIDGFVEAFLNAGANSVLSTLWPISDQSAKIFMEDFYYNYNLSNDFSNAIYKTKLNFINGNFGEKYKDSFHWSPYILYK